MGELRQRVGAAGPPLRHLSEGSVAQFRAVGELPHPFRQRVCNAEQRQIDAIMYRITDRAHADALLDAVARGVTVRLITEPEQYRDESRMWHAWNVDRLYMGGVQIKHRAHQG